MNKKHWEYQFGTKHDSSLEAYRRDMLNARNKSLQYDLEACHTSINQPVF